MARPWASLALAAAAAAFVAASYAFPSCQGYLGEPRPLGAPAPYCEPSLFPRLLALLAGAGALVALPLRRPSLVTSLSRTVAALALGGAALAVAGLFTVQECQWSSTDAATCGPPMWIRQAFFGLLAVGASTAAANLMARGWEHVRRQAVL